MEKAGQEEHRSAVVGAAAPVYGRTAAPCGEPVELGWRAPFVVVARQSHSQSLRGCRVGRCAYVGECRTSSVHVYPHPILAGLAPGSELGSQGFGPELLEAPCRGLDAAVEPTLVAGWEHLQARLSGGAS